MLPLISDDLFSGKPGDIGKGVSIREILLLNKRSGLPILSRVYGRSMGKDPVMIAGLLTAIIQFAESFSDNLSLNDIGIKGGSRLFVRSENYIGCIIIVENFDIALLKSEEFMILINEIASRIFEGIRMMFASDFLEPLSPLEEILEISYEKYIADLLSDLDGTKMESYPEVGYIIDNIILETTMMFSMKDEEVEEALHAMEEEDVTYLSDQYSGVSKKIDVDARAKLKDAISKIKILDEEE